MSIFRQSEWADIIGPNTELHVAVKNPETMHIVTPQQIRRWCDGVAVSPVGTGILIGLPCAYVLARALKTALFQLEPFDPPTAALSLLTLLAVALLAAWIPARRAARIDPMTALREE